jgi:hypothetical protein
VSPDRTAALLALAAGCVVARHPVAVPPPGEPAALVGSAALIHPLNDLARHPWVALRDRDGNWERWEVMCCPEDGGEMGTVRRSSIDPLDDHGGGGGDVRVHGVWRGAEAERIATCVRREAPAYPHRASYHAWPGPNSNTFIDWLIRRCSMHVDLPGPNIGKDYRGLIGVSTTGGGTGVQLETPLAGLKLGLTEGIEVHVLGLALGVDFWPPALIVPLGPGRIGFDDR